VTHRPSALIGASHSVEPAIALFGFQSGAAIATVGGVPAEVPIMLPVVSIIKRSQRWYERV
jgi:ACR3 family arsenite transporter